MGKTFTLSEANQLLPELERLLRTAMESYRQMEAAQRETQQTTHDVSLSGGRLLFLSDMLTLKHKRENASRQFRDAVGEIAAVGVQVKDLQIGLLDFPCQVEGEIVLLCWKLGEPTIAYWHGPEEGFKGRKPIDARIARAGTKPN